MSSGQPPSGVLKGAVPLVLRRSEDGKVGIVFAGDRIGAVAPGGPAAVAGVQPGMRVLAVESRQVGDDTDEVAAALAAAPRVFTMWVGPQVAPALTAVPPSPRRRPAPPPPPLPAVPPSQAGGVSPCRRGLSPGAAEGISALRSELAKGVGELRDELARELRQDLQRELRDELLRSVSRELREELLGALLNVLQGEVRDGLQAELRDEIERERRVSAQDSLNERLRWESERDGVRERLDTLASRIDSAVVRATQAVDNMTQRMDPRLCMLEGDRDDTSKRWKQQQKAHSLLQDDFIKMELKLREVEEYHHDNIAKLLTRTLPDALETHNQGHATRAAALEQRINELDSSIQEAVHHDGLREQLRAAVRDHNKLQQLVHQLERNSSDAGLEMHQMKTAGETRKDHWDRALEELHKKIAVLKEEHVQKAAEVHFDMEQREHVTTEQAVALDQLRSRVQTLDSLLQHHKELGTQDVDELRTKLDRLNAAHEKLLGRVDGVQAYLPELAQEQNRCTNQVVDGIRQNTDAALDALRTQIEQLREAVAVGDVERAKLKSDVEGSRAGQSSQASPAGSPKRDADVALLTSRLDDVVARLQIVERVAALASPKDLPGAAPSPSLPNRLAAQEQRCDAMASQLDAFLQSLGAARSALQGMATRVEGIEARLDGAGARGAGPPLAAPGGGRPTQQALQALNDALNTGGVRGVRGALLGGGQVSPRREMPMPAPTALPPQLLPPAPSPAPPLGGARPPPPPGGRPPAPYTVRQPGKWGAETPSIWQESRGAYPGPSLGPTPTGPSPRQSASVVGGSPYKR